MSTTRRPPGPSVPDHTTVNQFRWVVLKDPKQQRTLNARRLGRALAARARELHLALNRHPTTNELMYPQRVWDDVLARDGQRYFDEDVESATDNVAETLAEHTAEIAKIKAQLEVMALALRGSK